MVGLKEDPPRWIRFVLLASLPGFLVSLGTFTRSRQFKPFDIPRGIRRKGPRDARFRQLGLSDNWRLTMAGEASITLVASHGFSSCAGELMRLQPTSIGFGRHGTCLRSCDLRHSPLWTLRRSLGWCRSGYHGLDCDTWPISRGRHPVACLVTWAIVAFDAMFVHIVEHSGRSTARTAGWRSAFVVLLGTTSLVKGIGFGAVLIFSVIGCVLVWHVIRF